MSTTTAFGQNPFIAFFRDLVHNFPHPAWMNVAAGGCTGMIIGTTPLLIYFQSVLSNCALATSETDCGSVSSSQQCQWDKLHSVCLGASSVCDPKWNVATCAAAADFCTFSSARSQCEQTRGYGWNNGEVGLVASASVMGAVIGGFIASLASKQEQPKRLGHFGIIVVAAALAAWAGWIFFTHNAIVTGLCFIVVGIGFGGFFALTPPTVASVIPAAVRSTAGIFFQLSIVFGIDFFALIGLVFQSAPALACHILFIILAISGGVAYYTAEKFFTPIYVAFDANNISSSGSTNNNTTNIVSHESNPSTTPPHMATDSRNALTASSSSSDLIGQRHRISNNPNDGPDTIDGFFPHDDISHITSNNRNVIVVPSATTATAAAATTTTTATSSNNNINNDTISASKQSLIKFGYIFGFFVAASLQVTGINAIMSAAPKITQAAGISNVLAGNFLIMFVNAVTVLPSLVLGQKFSPFKLYIFGLVSSSCFCIFTAIAMMMQSSSLALLCVCGFLLLFESCQGPMFFMLATEIFPPEIRAAAASRVNLVTFFFNVLVNGLFPSLCAALQPVGDPAGGVRRVFILFGFLGFGCATALYLLYPKTLMSISSTNNNTNNNSENVVMMVTQQQNKNTAEEGAITAGSTPPPTAGLVTSSRM